MFNCVYLHSDYHYIINYFTKNNWASVWNILFLYHNFLNVFYKGQDPTTSTIAMYRIISQSWLWQGHIEYCYHISSKSHCTLKSLHPWIAATYFSQLIPINATLEISPHGKGLTTIICVYVCAHTLYVHTNRLPKLCIRVHVDLCRCCPWNLAALKLLPQQPECWNRILPQRDFKEIR